MAGGEKQDKDERQPGGEAGERPTDETLSAGAGPALPEGVPLARGSPGEGGRTFGRYRIIGVIGRGAMGIVYRAHDPALDRDIALKVLIAGAGASPEQVERFFREAASAARLHHPNIVPIHELDVFEGKHYFTMDCIKGKGLDDIIEGEGLEPRRALEIAEKVARAIGYAHGQGVIHRDLKPSNLIVDQLGEPHVTDFGLAKELGEEAGLTRTGTVLGTPAYMSPEQAEGRKEIDARSDVYSLGAVLYEMLTRRAPFIASNLMALLRMAVEEEPTPPSRLGVRVAADVETICLKCLEKAPERRYQAAGELADDIRRFLNAEPILAHPPSVFYRLRKKVMRHKAAVAAAAAVLVAVLAGFFGWLTVRAERARAEAEWRLVFEDDFERGEIGEGWAIKGGKWELEGGALVCKGVDAAVLAPVRVGECVRIEYTGWVPKDKTPREFSCYLSGTDEYPMAGYFFGFGAHGNSCAKVERAAKLRDVLRRGGRFVGPGKKYRIRVEFADGVLRADVNGKPFLAWRDLFPISGGDRVGLYSWEEGARFDDVKVWVRRSAELVPALARGDSLYGAGQYEKAAEEYSKLAGELKGAIADEARLKEALSLVALVREERKKPPDERDAERIESSLAGAESALSSVSAREFSAQCSMGLAEIAVERGKPEEAARVIREAVARDPESGAALELRAWPLRAGHELRERPDFRAAAVLFESAARLAGQDDFSAARALTDAGRALGDLGESDRALELFGEAEGLRVPSASARARVWRGLTLRAMGRLDEALACFASVERDYPGRRAACASALLGAGAYGKRSEASKESLARAAAYRDQPRWSTPACFLLGEIDEREFERLMSDRDWRADVEYWKGEKALRQAQDGPAALREGRKKDAVKHFRRAVELTLPGETWPLLEARLRLKELGAPVPPLPWENKE